ncbi:hypothetical protein F4861DRAFT_226770 [Xylaria intraflava]|nr:hypothetical protein F4861DRAFT_226770 [Xylaria intraflava]
MSIRFLTSSHSGTIDPSEKNLANRSITRAIAFELLGNILLVVWTIVSWTQHAVFGGNIIGSCHRRSLSYVTYFSPGLAPAVSLDISPGSEIKDPVWGDPVPAPLGNVVPVLRKEQGRVPPIAIGIRQPHRWQGSHVDGIVEYYPEVGMIPGGSFFGLWVGWLTMYI